MCCSGCCARKELGFEVLFEVENVRNPFYKALNPDFNNSNCVDDFLGVEITFWDGRVRSVNSEVAPRSGSLFMNSVEFLSRHLASSWWPRPSGAPTTIISPLESTPNRTLRSSKSLRAAFGLLASLSSTHAWLFWSMSWEKFQAKKHL